MSYIMTVESDHDVNVIEVEDKDIEITYPDTKDFITLNGEVYKLGMPADINEWSLEGSKLPYSGYSMIRMFSGVLGPQDKITADELEGRYKFKRNNSPMRLIKDYSGLARSVSLFIPSAINENFNIILTKILERFRAYENLEVPVIKTVYKDERENIEFQQNTLKGLTRRFEDSFVGYQKRKWNVAVTFSVEIKDESSVVVHSTIQFTRDIKGDDNNE